MNKTAIIIQSRLKELKIPNKPFKIINKKEIKHNALFSQTVMRSSDE